MRMQQQLQNRFDCCVASIVFKALVVALVTTFFLSIHPLHGLELIDLFNSTYGEYEN